MTTPPPVATVPMPAPSFARQTAIYAAGIVLSKMLSFFMLPFYTHYLTPADYGVIQLIELTLEVASIIAGARLASGVFRYYHKAEDEASRRRVCATAFTLIGVGYAVMGVMVMLWRAPITAAFIGPSALQRGLVIAAATFVVQGLSIVPLSVLRIRDAAILYTVLTVGKGFLQALLNVFFLRAGWGVEGALLASLIAASIAGLASISWFVRWSGLAFDREVSRGLIRFGAPLMLGQIATFVLTFGDRYFLRHYVNGAEVGIYALAYQFGFLLTGLAYQPFAQAWESARFEVVKRPDRDAAFSRVFLIINLPLLGGAMGLAILAPAVIRVMADEAFWAAGLLVAPILAAYVVQSWSGLLDLGIVLKEQTRRFAQANYAAAAVCLLGYWLLIPPFGGMGAAVATLIAFVVRTFLIHFWSQRLEPIYLRWMPVRRIALVAVASAATAMALPSMPILQDVAARTGLLLLALSISWLWGLDVEDRTDVLLQGRRLLRRVGVTA